MDRQQSNQAWSGLEVNWRYFKTKHASSMFV